MLLVNVKLGQVLNWGVQIGVNKWLLFVSTISSEFSINFEVEGGHIH